MNYIKNYMIIIGENATFNEKRAASFIQTNVRLVTGKKIPILTDTSAPAEHEICV